MSSVYIDRRSDLKQERDGKEAKMAKELTLYKTERSPYEVEIAGLIKQVISKRLIPDDGLLLAENQHSYIQEKMSRAALSMMKIMI